MRRFISPAIAAAALSCVPMSSWADSFASASLGPVSIQLLDLDPTDGIDPSIKFFSYAYGHYAYASVRNRMTVEFGGDSSYAYAWEPVAIGGTVTAASVQAAVAGSGSALGSVLSISGQAAAGVPTFGTDHLTEFSAFIYSGRGVPAYFRLSANTLLLFSAEASVVAETNGVWHDGGGYAGDEYAHAYAELEISGAGPRGVGFQSSGDSLTVSASSSPGGASHLSATGLFTGSFLNLNSYDVSGELDLGVQVWGHSGATLVPEPRTYALMAAGLALVGGFARRRRTG